MTINIMTKSIALSAAAFALALTPLTAIAADRYAVIAVVNTTKDATVGMSYRWGDGKWEQARLQPGHARHFCYQFPKPNQDTNPPFHIKFDSSIAPGNYIESYHLMGFRAPDCDLKYAHKYNFQYEVKGKFVELYDPQKR